MKRLLLALAVVGILVIAASAQAATDTWPAGTSTSWNILESGATFVHFGANLDLSSSGTTDNNLCGYIANGWGPSDFSTNFSYAVKFYDNYNVAGNNGVNFGLIRLTNSTPDYILGGEVENYKNYNNENVQHFRVSEQKGTGTIDTSTVSEFRQDVIIQEGWIGMKYDASTKKLNFSLFDADGNWLIGQEFSDPQSLTGSPMNVFLAAYSDQAIGSGVIGFSDLKENPDFTFGVTPVTAAPEPVSCTLFLLGGGALALVRRRK